MNAARASKSSNRAMPLGGSRFARALPARARGAGPGRSRLVVAQFLALATVFTAAPAAGQTRAGASNPSEAPATRALNEVDRFMEPVFANRDTSWRRLGDFILREVLTLDLEAPLDMPISGFRREYEWTVRDSLAVRRPVRFDGADIDEGRRRDYERQWLREERRRRARRDRGDPEPRFVSDAHYFADFPFAPGSYYFAGRETVAGREAVRIEHYPAARVDQGFDARINRGFNKTSLVTFWVDPEVHQIVKYTFDNPGLDFLRFRWLLRVEGLESSTEMAPVGGAWLPARVTISGRVTTALGRFGVTLTREFLDYREAETGARLVDPGSPR